MLSLVVLLCHASFLNRWVVKTIGRPRAAPRSRPFAAIGLVGVFFLARFSRWLLRHVDERSASVLLVVSRFRNTTAEMIFVPASFDRNPSETRTESKRETERARACTRERRLVVSARRTVQRFGPAHRSETTAAATRQASTNQRRHCAADN